MAEQVTIVGDETTVTIAEETITVRITSGPLYSSSGGGAVASVNGQTGTVVLDAADVGADAYGAASTAVTAHVAATDPHGDRAYASGLVNTEAAARVAADALLIPSTARGAASGVASLDSDGKVPASQLPSLSGRAPWVVADQSAMLALSSAIAGDLAIRTDNGKTFILGSLPASTLGNWIDITPASGVTSVNTRTGAVSGLAEQSALDAEATARAAADAAHVVASDPHGDRAAASSALAAHTSASDPHGDRAAASSALSGHVAASDPHGDRAAASSALSTHTAASDPHGDRAFATAAVTAHTAATDPHGDRAAASSALSTHTAASDPHGDRAFASTVAGAAVTAHVAATDPHGDRAYASGLVTTEATARAAADAARYTRLVMTALRTADAAAVADSFTPVDTTSGPIVITMPSSPADKALVGVGLVDGANPATVTLPAAPPAEVVGATKAQTWGPIGFDYDTVADADSLHKGTAANPVTDADAVFMAERCDWFVDGANTPFSTRYALMRATNPAIKILMYMLDTFSTGDPVANDGSGGRHPAAYYAYDGSGNVVRRSALSTSVLMDPLNADWLADRIAFAQARVTGRDLDGIELDTMGVAGADATYLATLPVHATSGSVTNPATGTTYTWSANAAWTKAEWRAQMLVKAAAFKTALTAVRPGALVFLNAVNSGQKYFDATDLTSEYAIGVDKKTMVELFVRNDSDTIGTWSGTAWTGGTWRSETIWKQDVDMLVDAAGKSASLWCITKVWNTVDSARSAQLYAYAYATFMLGQDAAHTHTFTYSDARTWAGLSAARAFEGLDFGTPTGAYTIDTGGGVNVYRRDFQDATVLVNPTSSNHTTAVALGRSMFVLDPATGLPTGSPVTSVTVNAHTAVILATATSPFDDPSGPTTTVLDTPGQALLAQYDAARNVWQRLAGHLPATTPLSHWGPATADLDAGGHKITDLADPTADTDAVNLRSLLSRVGLRTIRTVSAAGAPAEITAQRVSEVSGGNTGTGNVSTITTNYPAAPTVGNLLYMVVTNQHTSTGAPAPTTPTGWTFIGASNAGTGTGSTLRAFAYYRFADGDADLDGANVDSLVISATNVDANVDQGMKLDLYEFSGIDSFTGAWIGASTGTTNVNTLSATTSGGSTPAVGDLALWSATNGSGTASAPVWTSSTAMTSTPAGNAWRLVDGKRVLASAGHPSETITWSGTARPARLLGAVFRPAAVDQLADGDLVLVDTTAGDCTEEVPAAPTTGFRCLVQLVAGTNTVTIQGGTFKTASGPTSLTLTDVGAWVDLRWTGTYWQVLESGAGGGGGGTVTAGSGISVSGSTVSIDTAVTVDKTTAQTLANKTLTAPAITSPTGLVKGDVGLGNVTNNAQVVDPGANGLVARTASGAASARTITAGSAKVTVTNGSGAAGNPTVDLGSVASTDLSDSSSLYRSGGTDVAVADGGTGASALTAHYVVVGNGTSAVTMVAPGSSGTVLMSNGASSDPSFQPVPDSNTGLILARALFK